MSDAVDQRHVCPGASYSERMGDAHRNGVAPPTGKGVLMTPLTESTLLGLEEHLFLLTPQAVRERIEYYQKQLRIWQALLPVVGGEEPPPAPPPRTRQDLRVKPTAAETNGHNGHVRRPEPPIWRRIYDYLREHGPAQVVDISSATGLRPGQIYTAMQRGDFMHLPGKQFAVQEPETNGAAT